MKKIAVLAAFCSIFLTSSVNAGAIDIEKEVTCFVGGLLAGVATHEGGHWIMSKANGEKTELRWKGVYTSARRENFALGGFASQIISSEILLYSKAPKDNSFIVGWLTWNIINPLYYIFNHEFGYESSIGDLKFLDDNDQNRSLKVEHVEIAIATHALFTAYRLWKNEDFQKSKIRSYLKFSKSKDKIQGGLTWDF